jgi:DNA-binding transcriptional ArsR family regulator
MATPTDPTGDDRVDGSAEPEARIAKALAHPLRARILERLGERVASPAELAGELDAPLGVVSYHVRMLRDYQCVELVRTEPQRGALQHFYRATARPALDADQRRSLPAGLRRALSAQTLSAVVADLGSAAESGALRDGEPIVTRAPLALDARARARLNRLLARAESGALAIAAESAQRAEADSSTADERFRTELVLMHFARAESEAPGGF